MLIAKALRVPILLNLNREARIIRNDGKRRYSFCTNLKYYDIRTCKTFDSEKNAQPHGYAFWRLVLKPIYFRT